MVQKNEAQWGKMRKGKRRTCEWRDEVGENNIEREDERSETARKRGNR